MAKRKPAASATQTHPHAYPYVCPQPLTTRIVDALDHLDSHLMALEAVEQLMAPQKAGSTEDLSHVNRQGLAFMFCLLNVAVRKEFAEAKALADAAYADMRATNH
jgi:hypothetical protein